MSMEREEGNISTRVDIGTVTDIAVALVVRSARKTLTTCPHRRIPRSRPVLPSDAA